MLNTYKFAYVTYDTETGIIQEAGVRFYEAEIKTDSVTGAQFYGLKARLPKEELEFTAGDKSRGMFGDIVIYTKKHFGEIKGKDQLCDFLNKELVKDKKRQPVPVQSEIKH